MSSPSTASTFTSSDARPSGAVESQVDLAILGGGISGLALAAWAKQAGLNIRVIEKSPNPGGVMQSYREDGFLFEQGPNTVLDRDPSFDELLSWSGLADRALRAPLRGVARYIWHGNRLHEVPSSPISAITTRLLSWNGKFRLLKEPWVPPMPEDEPLREFAIRRLGREAYDRALVPMVSGISGGDPASLSTEYSFPVLKELEREGGGLVRGMLARRKRPDRPKRRAAYMVSFPEGLRELPEAIAGKLGNSYQGATEVKGLTPQPSGSFLIETSGGPLEASQVALCADASALRQWIRPWLPELGDLFGTIHYCPLAVVGLGIDSSSATIPEGFGFLSAAGSEIRTLGAIFSGQIFPGRSPAGTQLLTVMLGGDRDPQALEFDDQELLGQVRKDLAQVIRWNGQARATRIVRWKGAIPQYTMNHPALLKAIEAAETAYPGLYFFGNWRAGAAVGERVRLAREVVAGLPRKKAEIRD